MILPSAFLCPFASPPSGDDRKKGPDPNSQEKAALVRSQLRAGVNVWRCSSAGRLFDAFAALLGVCAVNRHEGEAPMRLEAEAWKAARAGENVESYPFGLAGEVLDWAPMWREAAGSAEAVARIALRILRRSRR